ncbi:unnamed protein product, partial [Polarella glacialis]
VLVLELEEAYCEQGRKRAAALAVSSPQSAKVCFRCQDLRSFAEPFDLAVGLHACGPLVDAVLEQCFVSKAEFVLLTCCFGKIPKRAADFGLSPLVPKSWWGDGERLADGPEDKESSQAMRIVNSDRCCWVRQRGGWAHLFAIPRSVTNKNIIVAGAACALRAGLLDVAGTPKFELPEDLQGVPLLPGPTPQAPGTVREVEDFALWMGPLSL